MFVGVPVSVSTDYTIARGRPPRAGLPHHAANKKKGNQALLARSPLQCLLNTGVATPVFFCPKVMGSMGFGHPQGQPGSEADLTALATSVAILVWTSARSPESNPTVYLPLHWRPASATRIRCGTTSHLAAPSTALSG